MSISYWIIEGIGLNVADIEPHISKEKTVRFLSEQFPDEMDWCWIIC